MKTFTKVVAVLLAIVAVASLMAACGEKNHIDEKLVGTWKQTDDVEGNWIWTFNNDGTCKLVGETTGFSDEGTYLIENPDNGKIKIKLSTWSEESLFSYTATSKSMILENFEVSYYCDKQ